MISDKISKKSKEILKSFSNNKTPYGSITYYLGHPMILKPNDVKNFYIDYEVNSDFVAIIE